MTTSPWLSQSLIRDKGVHNVKMALELQPYESIPYAHILFT